MMTGQTEFQGSSPDRACRILIADDNRDLCAALGDVLEVEHHRVEPAYSGAATLAACSREAYDVLLLDIGLPDLSGLDLIDRLEEMAPDLDILVISGRSGLNSSAVQAVSRSTIGYLTKPIDIDRLLAILEGIAQRKGLARENRRIEEERETLIRELEEKNAELERYTYTVSHDLKSPLITIKGFLGLIERSAVAGDLESLRLDISRVAGAADHMYQLLDDLLELLRVGRVVNPVEDIALEPLIRCAVDLVCQAIDEPAIDEPAIDVRVDADLPLVRGDRPRLIEVFQHLLDNAFKFMGDQPEPRVEIGARQDQGEILCYVRDNGIGIDPRYQQTIFGLFDQLDPKRSGTGIGLAVVKRTIGLHGGRIWAESGGFGEGVDFYFTLPGQSCQSVLGVN